MNCAFCGRVKEDKDLTEFGEVKICWLCKNNQKEKPRGRVIKTKHGIQDNSYLSQKDL